MQGFVVSLAHHSTPVVEKKKELVFKVNFFFIFIFLETWVFRKHPKTKNEWFVRTFRCEIESHTVQQNLYSLGLKIGTPRHFFRKILLRLCLLSDRNLKTTTVYFPTVQNAGRTCTKITQPYIASKMQLSIWLASIKSSMAASTSRTSESSAVFSKMEEWNGMKFQRNIKSVKLGNWCWKTRLKMSLQWKLSTILPSGI